MASPNLKWRLEDGYSRFLDGSAIELSMINAPVAGSIELHPIALFKKREPVEFLFKIGHSCSGQTGPGLRWRLGPESRVRGLLLFPGNSYLGGFRTPRDKYAIQWDVEATVDVSLAKEAAPCLVGLRAGGGLSQSWVTLFPEECGLASAFVKAWGKYRDPFSPEDARQLDEGQLVRWKWDGHAQLELDVSWGVAAGWVIPGDVPWVDFQKQLTALAGMGASFTVREEGEFSLQLRRQKARLSLQLKRKASKTAGASLSVGVQIKSPGKIDHLGPSKPAPLKIASDALGQPVLTQLNRVLEKSLSSRLAIALSVSSEGWRSNNRVIDALWSRPNGDDFTLGYCQILSGRIPAPSADFKVSGRFESVRGKRFSVSFSLLDWVKLRSASERRTENVVTVGPGGEIVIEHAELFEKASYRWDELQFLRLTHRELSGGKDANWDFWTWGVEDEMSQERLDRLLHAALHCGIVRQFSLPGKSAFPLRARLVLGSRFSPQGLGEVRLADAGRKWKALVRAFELVEPERYAPRSCWRDWVDSAELRQAVEANPVQADLETIYPIPGRTPVERALVVAAYRKARRFLTLLDHWKRGENEYVLKAFEMGMDVPIFVFFHLLCPPELRSSAALLSGGLEQSWGDLSLFEGLE